MKDQYPPTGIFINGVELFLSSSLYTGGYPEGTMKAMTNYDGYLLPSTATTVHIERKPSLKQKIQQIIERYRPMPSEVIQLFLLELQKVMTEDETE